MEHSRDLLSEQSYRAVAAAYRSCADRLRRDGVDLAGYSIPEEVDDLEAARRALGYHQIDLVSESAGTRVAMIYAWRYPKSIHRSVMIGVNPPGNFLWDAKTTGEQIRRYAALCAQATSCRSRTAESRRVAEVRVRSRSQSLAVPADQEGRLPSRRVLRPDQRDLRRRRPDRRATDDQHAPLRRRGRRKRCVVPVADGTDDLSERVRLGRHGGDQPQRRHLREALLRVGSRPWIADRFSRQRPDLGRRPPRQRLAGEPGRERVHPRAELEHSDVADRRQPRLRNAARECDPRAPASPRERPSGRALGPRPRRRLLALRTGSRHPSDQHLPRHRQGRHVPLHPQQGRLQPKPKPRRSSPRTSSAR